MPECPPSLLAVSHEATRTGAVHSLLHLLEFFREKGSFEIRSLLFSGGANLKRFEAFGPVTKTSERDRERISTLLDGVDIILVNSAASSSALRSLGELGVPIVLFVHELMHELSLINEQDLVALSTIPDRYISCSEAVASNLQSQLGISADKIDIIGELVPIERILARATSSTDESGSVNVPENIPLVGAVGNPSWRKGIDLFLHTAATFLNEHPGRAHFVWIGGGESRDERQRIEFEIDQLKLRDSVTITGILENPFPIISALDVFTLTSREDPYPLVMIEAAVLGIPIAGFAGSGGFDEFARDFGGLVVSPRTPDAMAGAVAELLDSPELGKHESLDIGALDVSRLAPRFKAVLTETLKGTAHRPSLPASDVAGKLTARQYPVEVRLVSDHSRIFETVVHCNDTDDTFIELPIDQNLSKPGRIRLSMNSGPAGISLTGLIAHDGDGHQIQLPATAEPSMGSGLTNDQGKWIATGYQSRIYISDIPCSTRKLSMTIRISIYEHFLNPYDDKKPSKNHWLGKLLTKSNP